MADVANTLAAWSSTTGSNAPSGATNIGTGLDDNLREIQGVLVRGLSHKGSDIASSTTPALGATEGLMHDITGTATITGFDTVRAGIWKVLKFEGAATLTHNATNLILPSAANITTADGDVALFISEGSGNWRCLGYSRANGLQVFGTKTANTVLAGPVSGSAAVAAFRALVGADGASMVLLSSQAASTSAALDFTSMLGTTYDSYELHLSNIRPATDNVNLLFRGSVDNGSNYLAGTEYNYATVQNDTSSVVTITGGGGAGASAFLISAGIGNASGRGVSGVIKFQRTAGSVSRSQWHVSFTSNSGNDANNTGGGIIGSNDVNALRLIMSSGNITSGTASLYGIKKA